MKSLADELPPEVASAIHPDWRRNEAAYWAARDVILAQYRNKWVAFADGAVIASFPTPAQMPAHFPGRIVNRFNSTSRKEHPAASPA